uniref:BHLH domain-containing protein n=1 Tax=Ananas comosus var. bracteatus TaxID=296719 RepID=A0A6V7QQW2_ANACO
MVSESEQSSSMANGEIVAERPAGRSVPSKKSQGQVPKKIHKAEREKLKRDQLNDLFSKLDKMLEPDRQNNGKACILSDTTRIVRDLIAQVESLRKENAALQTESHYVTTEKNELRDENAALQAQISDLQCELRARMGYNGVWTNPPNVNTINALHPTTNPMLQQPPVIERAFTTPPRELQLFPGAAGSPDHESPSPRVRRPHARYATPSNTWTERLLPGLRREAQEEEQQQSSSGITESSREDRVG